MNGILSRIGSLPLRIAKKLPTDDLYLIVVLCRADSENYMRPYPMLNPIVCTVGKIA